MQSPNKFVDSSKFNNNLSPPTQISSPKTFTKHHRRGLTDIGGSIEVDMTTCPDIALGSMKMNAMKMQRYQQPFSPQVVSSKKNMLFAGYCGNVGAGSTLLQQTMSPNSTMYMKQFNNYDKKTV